MCDTRLYVVEFLDGNIWEYVANIIAESIYSQVDDKGQHYLLLEEAFADHVKDDTAVPMDGRCVHPSEDAIFHWRFEIMCKCRIISLIPGIT